MLICSLLKFRSVFHGACLQHNDLLMSELGLETLLDILHARGFILDGDHDDPTVWDNVLHDIRAELTDTIELNVINELWNENSLSSIINQLLSSIQGVTNRDEYYEILVLSNYGSLILVEG